MLWISDKAVLGAGDSEFIRKGQEVRCSAAG